jgi:hypothetical protein
MKGSIWVRLRLGIAGLVIDFLKRRAVKLHQDARNEPDPVKSLGLRVQADDSDENAEHIKQRLLGKE